MDIITHAIWLVQRLNDPQFASEAAATSEQLHDIQRSPQGWQVADALLQSEDQSRQFYGALTFQIKLNRDAQNLPPADAKAVLERLLEKFAKVVNDAQAAHVLVLDKLCSALATYIVQLPESWNNALGEVATYLVNGATTVNQGNDGRDHANVISRLQAHQVNAMLRLSLIHI